MTKLKKFGGKYKDETVERIARYFGFSAGLHFGTDKPDESRMKAAKKTLKEKDAQRVDPRKRRIICDS